MAAVDLELSPGAMPLSPLVASGAVRIVCAKRADRMDPPCRARSLRRLAEPAAPTTELGAALAAVGGAFGDSVWVCAGACAP